MKKYIPVMLAIILGMTTMFVGHKVSALSCAPATLQQQIDSATVIFAGKVTAVQTATSDKAANASFDVIEYWEGQVGKKISVGGIYAWTGYVNPPSYFIVGNTYLVFANSIPASSEAKNIPDNLIASINCGRTTLLESATEIKTVLGQGKIPTGQSSFTFTRNLTVGFSGEDVVALQTFLEQRGFLIMPSGIAKGYFGGLTRSALVKYQRSEGITPAVGYFGPLTRKSVSENQVVQNKTITVLSPNNGETWQIGSSQDIKWNAPVSMDVVNIRVVADYCDSTSISCGSGSVYVFQVDIVRNTPNTGVFNWRIPSDLIGLQAGSRYRIQILDRDFKVQDKSDIPFTIIN